MQRISRPTWFLAATLLIACVAAWPLLAEPGLLNTRGGGDSPFLLQRLHQLETAVRDGHFPVRWMPDAYYGYGYPFYNFYAPLSIYIAAAFRLAGWNLVQAIKLAQLAGFLTAAGGMFYLGRRWFRHDGAGLLTAVAYTTAPFHMANVYVRGDSLAEFWAMAFYPLTLLAVDTLFGAHTAVVRKPVMGGLLALAYAGLILSHNISALIFSPFLLLYMLLRWGHQIRQEKQGLHLKATGGPLAGALLLALALSAWFFVPALAEKGQVQLGPVTEGYFHFSNHFLGDEGRPLTQSTFFFNYGVDGLAAFSMGLVQTAVVIAGVGVLLATWRHPEPPQSYRRWFLLLALLISTFMLLPYATWLWQHLPLLAFTQFPWRFLSVQAFAGALAAGGLALLPWRRWRQVVVPLTALLLCLSALGDLHPDHLPLTGADITAEKLAQYEWFSGNVGTTVSAEYLPQTVQPRMVTGGWLQHGERDVVQAVEGRLLASRLIERRTGRQQWRVETAVASTLIFPTLYWPGWTAEVDGATVAAQSAPGSGLLMVEVPAGTHQVRLRLARTPVRLAAEAISLAAVLGLLWLLRPLRPGKKPVAILVGAIGLCALAGYGWPERPWAGDDLTWDFAQMAYLHHAPQGVPFDHGLRLRRYQYSAETILPGVPFTIITEWEGAAGQPVTVQLTTPASHRYQDPAPPPLATATETVTDGRATFQLMLPPHVPSGLVVPRLTMAGARALTPSGQERGPLFLRPLRLQNDPPALAAPSGLDVQPVAVSQTAPDELTLALAWYTPTPLSHNYNLALRLTDAQGQFLALSDLQPGYGFQPSSLWPPGRWTPDWLAMALPAGRHDLPYILVAQLIDVTQPQRPVLSRRLGELRAGEGELVFVPTTPVFTLPPDLSPATAVYGGKIGLRGYRLDVSGGELALTLAWESLVPMERDYTRFVHLLPVSGRDQPPLRQQDGLPQQGTYPTSQWQRQEIVTDSLTIDLAGLPAGTYVLAVGYYENVADGTFPRLTAVDDTGNALPDNRFFLPQTITVP